MTNAFAVTLIIAIIVFVIIVAILNCTDRKDGCGRKKWCAPRRKWFDDCTETKSCDASLTRSRTCDDKTEEEDDGCQSLPPSDDECAPEPTSCPLPVRQSKRCDTSLSNAAF